MSRASSKPLDQWLQLDCPRCKVRFRIKSAYAHMNGRCPNCGRHIEAPQPVPPAAPVSFNSDEPLGLVPIDEEWPELGQMDVDDRPMYDFGAPPTRWAEPKPERPPEVQGYALQGGGLQSPSLPPDAEPIPEAYLVQAPDEVAPSRTSSSDPLAEAYQVDLPIANSSIPATAEIPEENNEPERVPSPPPLPPAWPLWRGVYSYPWRVENLKSWIALGVGLTLFAFLATIFYQMIFVAKIMSQEGFHPEAALAVLTVPGMAILGILVALYASAQFRAILQDTASGNETHDQPELVTDWFGSFFHLGYIGFFTLIPSVMAGAAAATLLESGWGWSVAAGLTFLLFPVFLLSSMAANTSLAILNGNVLRSTFRKAWLLPVLFLASSALAAACLGLVYLTLTTSNFLIALATGFAWSACLIIYARLLGRVAWVLSQTGVKVRKRPKKPRNQPTLGPDDWGDGMDEPAVSALR
jgi:hypothetical protein